MRNTVNSALFGCCLLLAPAQAFEVQPRIVGGCESATSAHPWMVALATKLASNNGTYEWTNSFCGATLVNERWVMTAAHCLSYMSSSVEVDFAPADLEVYIGTTRLDSGQGAHYAISEIHKHPNYNNPALFSNDIALLKLAETVPEAAARLATVKPGNDLLALTAGWGKLEDVIVTQENVSALLPRDLREVSVSILDNSLCPFNLTDSQICAGFLAGGKDSCQGDSGGPLMLKSQGQDTLVGIVSFGDGCAQENSPGVYTSVAAYRDWIAQTTTDPSTGISDLPAPVAISENYAHFSACGATPVTTSVPEPTKVISTGGGGSAGLILFTIALLGLNRRQPALLPKANSKKA